MKKRSLIAITLIVGFIASVAIGDVLVTPTSFLIAPDGTITKHTIGEMDMNGLRDSIISMLPNQSTVAGLGSNSTPLS